MLVSSFLASLLLGAPAPIDTGDGAGMNLLDLARRQWSPAALAATAPDLARRLGEPTLPDRVLGQISPYFVRRHGFAPDCRVAAWSGDNPCSLIGTGLVSPGRLGLSLGTSDTCFGFLAEPRTPPGGEGHVFGSPTGDYMTLLCFKNGSLAREKIRDAHGLDWAGFAAALERTPPGNRGRLLLPWFEPEIVPAVLEPGARRYDLEPGDAAGEVRAVVEAQMLSMYLHSRWMGVEPRTIYATGGASRNPAILAVMANVNGAEVYQFDVSNSAALGAALRAVHALLGTEPGGAPSWEETVADFAKPVAGSRVAPDARTHDLYLELGEIYRQAEAHALGRGPDPRPRLAEFRGKFGGGKERAKKTKL